MSGPRRQKRQGERKSAGDLDQVAESGGLGIYSPAGEPAAQEALGLIVVEQVQRHSVDAARDQAAQLLATGDDSATWAGPRQQRENLPAVAGIVKHYKDAPFGQRTPVQRRALVESVGYAVLEYAEGGEEASEDVMR
jgi:hypothetical protein